MPLDGPAAHSQRRCTVAACQHRRHVSPRVRDGPFARRNAGGSDCNPSGGGCGAAVRATCTVSMRGHVRSPAPCADRLRALRERLQGVVHEQERAGAAANGDALAEAQALESAMELKRRTRLERLRGEFEANATSARACLGCQLPRPMLTPPFVQRRRVSKCMPAINQSRRRWRTTLQRGVSNTQRCVARQLPLVALLLCCMHRNAATCAHHALACRPRRGASERRQSDNMHWKSWPRRGQWRRSSWRLRGSRRRRRGRRLQRRWSARAVREAGTAADAL